MKKIYILTVLSASLLFSACSNDLNTLPSTSVPTANAIESIDEYQKALNGIFQRMSYSQYLHAGSFGFYADCKGGDTKIIINSNQISDITNFALNKQHHQAKGFYQWFSLTSSWCNMALEGGEKLKDQKGYAQITGQLYASRALLHFDMARVYAQIPTVNGIDINKPNSGIVINDRVFNVFDKFTRSTLKETYDFIISDLEKAISLLPEKYIGGGINKYAAQALLARVQLYYGNWEGALKNAEVVISKSEAKLYTPENYAKAWTEQDTNESLFEVYTTDNIKNNPQRTSLGGFTSINGYAEVAINDGLLSIFNNMEDSTDIRKNMIVKEVHPRNGATGWFTTKYKGRNDASINKMYVNNPKIIRLAEVYYIASEAALKLGQQDKADKYYNELRKTRFESGFVAKQNITIDDILAERRIELFCENHRLFDLVRNNKEVPSWNTAEMRKPNAFDIICPIPQSETDVNPGLVQNPGF